MFKSCNHELKHITKVKYIYILTDLCEVTVLIRFPSEDFS